MTPSQRVDVGSDLVFDIADHASIALQVAVASTAGAIDAECLEADLDGSAVDVREVAVDHGGRIHLLDSGPGTLTVRYTATVRLDDAPDTTATEAEALLAVRQSRYCPSDVMEDFAPTELGPLDDGPGRGRAIGEWVHRRLRYEPASSDAFDTAVDTLLAGRGVCRDFAHLTIALCRAVGVPARLVSVYAPGISPMDFHAVAEVAAGGRWEVVDATRLAPRSSLVRIATGRDAADTAFAMTLRGSAELCSSVVTAVVDGDLPLDDHTGPLLLP